MLRSIDRDILDLLNREQVCVAFSGGKDSVAMWSALVRDGVRPVAAYPRDFERIKVYFPLIEAELIREARCRRSTR
jgi:predicted phosphoadenosine phosphosulfate sulfurtransferase